MADTKISALPDASTLDGSELLLLSQGSADKKISLDDLVSDGYFEGIARPSDWPTMPTVAAESVAYLLGVEDVDSGANFIRITASVSSGTWAVNWGDGTSTTGLASGATADHEFDYADFSGDPVTSEGWKGSIIVVTTSGGNLTACHYSGTHPNDRNNTKGNVKEAVLNVPNQTAVPNWEYSRSIRRITYTALGAATSFANAFANLINLEDLVLPVGWGSSLTTAASMLNGCSMLARWDIDPNFGTNLTNINSLFRSCTSLRRINLPAGFAASSTNCVSLFQGCLSIRSLILPSGFGALCTSGSYMFHSMQQLEELILPSGFGASLTDCSNMFNSCSRLKKLVLPSGFAPGCTDTTHMFSYTSLIEVEFPSGFGGSVVTCASMFNNAFALSKINFPAGFGASLNPAIDQTPCAWGAFYTEMTNFECPASFTIWTGKMSAAALDRIYTDLPTVVGKTITIQGNYGTAGDDPSIATAKGWTVVGS